MKDNERLIYTRLSNFISKIIIFYGVFVIVFRYIPITKGWSKELIIYKDYGDSHLYIGVLIVMFGLGIYYLSKKFNP